MTSSTSSTNTHTLATILGASYVNSTTPGVTVLPPPWNLYFNFLNPVLILYSHCKTPRLYTSSSTGAMAPPIAFIALRNPAPPSPPSLPPPRRFRFTTFIPSLVSTLFACTLLPRIQQLHLIPLAATTTYPPLLTALPTSSTLAISVYNLSNTPFTTFATTYASHATFPTLFAPCTVCSFMPKPSINHSTHGIQPM